MTKEKTVPLTNEVLKLPTSPPEPRQKAHNRAVVRLIKDKGLGRQERIRAISELEKDME